MKVLLDTCVLSEIRHSKGNAAVKAAVRNLPDNNLFVSVLTIGEIYKGIALLPAANNKRQALNEWVQGLEAQYGEQILSIDIATTRLWGELSARAQKSGVVVPSIDGLLAASALRHGMQLMTRNSRHFEATGVIIIDPWQG